MKYSATSTPDSCGQLQKTAIHLHRNKSWPSAATSTFAASQRMADFGIRNWLIDRPNGEGFRVPSGVRKPLMQEPAVGNFRAMGFCVLELRAGLIAGNFPVIARVVARTSTGKVDDGF